MNRRVVVLVVGVLAFTLGIAELLVPGTVPLSVGEGAIPLLGVLALVYALFVLSGARRVGIDQAETPDVEFPLSTDPPGEDLDDTLNAFLRTGTSRLRNRARLLGRTREKLRSVALTILVRYTDRTEADARRQLSEGTWTTDPEASAFLRDERQQGQPLGRLLRAGFRSESPYERELRRTVDELTELAGVSGQRRSRSGPFRRVRSWITSPAPQRRSVSTDAQRSLEPDVGRHLRTTRHTGHLAGVSVVALAGIGVGLLAEQPAVLLAGIVGIGYTAYAHSFALETVELSVERTLGDEDPDPGDEVEVEVHVTNDGSNALFDLRIVDGVPDALAVTDGTPRLGTALRPGETATLSYSITARRGVHEFRPTFVAARNLPSTTEFELYVAAETRLTCSPPLQPTSVPVPLRRQAIQNTGRVETDSGGSGVEFYAVREYQPGDSISRIDWHRRARTGELSTVEFRRERAGSIVIAIDDSDSAYVSPTTDDEHAVDRSVDAVRRLFTRLLDDGHQVGITTLSSVGCWLPPGTGSEHRVQAQTLLTTHPALSPVPHTGADRVFQQRRQLRERLPPDTQLIVVSPLCEPSVIRSVRELDAYGYQSTVVSPDPTTDRTYQHRLTRVYRQLSIADLRAAGIRVIDWPWDAQLDTALETARSRLDK